MTINCVTCNVICKYSVWPFRFCYFRCEKRKKKQQHSDLRKDIRESMNRTKNYENLFYLLSLPSNNFEFSFKYFNDYRFFIYE